MLVVLGAGSGPVGGEVDRGPLEGLAGAARISARGIDDDLRLCAAVEGPWAEPEWIRLRRGLNGDCRVVRSRR